MSSPTDAGTRARCGRPSSERRARRYERSAAKSFTRAVSPRRASKPSTTLAASSRSPASTNATARLWSRSSRSSLRSVAGITGASTAPAASPSTPSFAKPVNQREPLAGHGSRKPAANGASKGTIGRRMRSDVTVRTTVAM